MNNNKVKEMRIYIGNLKLGIKNKGEKIEWIHTTGGYSNNNIYVSEKNNKTFLEKIKEKL